MELYRSIHKNVSTDNVFEHMTTARAPGNVPYLVDNLWEWKRPDHFPNRRYSVYASPSRELAQKFGGAGDGAVHKVLFEGHNKITQIKEQDSRYHPECRALPRLLFRHLEQEWIDSSVENKVDSGRLWMPCLRKEEVESLFNEIEVLKLIEGEIWNSIRYWDQACVLDDTTDPTGDGELFFEAPDGYRLVPV